MLASRIKIIQTGTFHIETGAWPIRERKITVHIEQAATVTVATARIADHSIIFARWRQCAPNLKHVFPRESTCQTAFRPVHSLLQGSLLCPADTHTYTTLRRGVCSNSPHSMLCNVYSIEYTDYPRLRLKPCAWLLCALSSVCVYISYMYVCMHATRAKSSRKRHCSRLTPCTFDRLAA